MKFKDNRRVGSEIVNREIKRVNVDSPGMDGLEDGREGPEAWYLQTGFGQGLDI